MLNACGPRADAALVLLHAQGIDDGLAIDAGLRCRPQVVALQLQLLEQPLQGLRHVKEGGCAGGSDTRREAVKEQGDPALLCAADRLL